MERRDTGMLHQMAHWDVTLVHGEGTQRWHTHAGRDHWDGVSGWHILEWYMGRGHRHARKYTWNGAWRCCAEMAHGHAGWHAVPVTC